MSIKEWARWIECEEGRIDIEDGLDIQQVPELIYMIQDKFFQGGQELRQYQGLFNIVCDCLPAPQLGMGFEKGKKEYLLSPFQNSFRQRVERLPLKDGNIKMSAQAFRIALIGSKAFEKSGVNYKSLFYSLGMKEKKYIIEKQPDLFPFKTKLPALIGCLSSIEILWQSSACDLFHDAALFGSETLLEAIKILRNIVPQLCLEQAEKLEEMLAYYTPDCRVSLSYQLVMHQLQLIEDKKLNKSATDTLLNCLNTYCATSDADTDLHTLVYPKHPLKRAQLIAEWLQNFPDKIEILSIPCSEITTIVLANLLTLDDINFKPDALIEEFDCLDFEEKKRFIVEILLTKKIEVLKGNNKTYFLQAVKRRCGSDLAASFKLALLAIGFIYCKSFGHETLPNLKHFELSSEIAGLSDADKKWFIDNILLDKDVLAFFFQEQWITPFFTILNDLKSSLESTFISPKLTIIEEKILELCPVEYAIEALTNLGKGDKIISSLKKYVSRRLEVAGFDSSLALLCKKFFEYEENEIYVVLAIATLKTSSDKFLINNPDFISCVPRIYQQDINFLIALIEPFDGKGVDPLGEKQQCLPMWLKDLLMNDLTFNSFFEDKIISRLNQLYDKGLIASEEMFFLATRFPYATFLKLAQECPYDFTASEAYIRFNHIDDTIPNHILAICRAIPLDPYATDDLRQFLNRYPKKVIGEGRWIQYLALEATNFFNDAIVKKIIEFMPMDLIAYVVEFLLPEDQLWFLNPSLEAIYSKNIDKFSPQVQGWLIDNLDKWFAVNQNIVHAVRSIWQVPRKGLNAKLTLFDETQILLNLFKKRNTEVQSLHRKLIGKPGFAKVDFLVQECIDLEVMIDPWLKKIDQIDLSPISDVITSEPLTGRVYSLEGKGWILEKTKIQMQISPYSRHPFVNDEEKDQKLPPLTSQESAELEERRLRTNHEIDALRTLILAEHMVDKHPALSN